MSSESYFNENNKAPINTNIQSFMKTQFTFSLLAAAAVCGLANAQTAYTTPVGYTTQTLNANSINLIGLTLQNTPLASGDFDTVSGTTLTDSSVTYSPQAGRTYVLEITESATAALVGTIQEIPAASISGSTITTTDNLASLGLQAGAKYNLRLAPTLEEIFGVTSSSALTRGLSATTADVVWLPTATAGVYNKYFIHSSTSAFRVAGTTTPAPNIPVIYADGLLIQKKSLAGTLTTVGEVKKVGTNSVIPQGVTPISIVAPDGLTLTTAGFDDDVTKGLSSTAADIIWIPNGVGTYAKYYLHSSQGWRNVATNTNIASDVVLPSAVFVQRKSATVMSLDLKVPTSYSSL
ncbi:MAG: hypothetical protein RLZ22_71 [Verrucomicrobiota bacterium]|jgi:hypothetical protein